MPTSNKINYKSIVGKVEMWSDTDGISWMLFAPGSDITEEDMREILVLTQSTLLSGEQLLALIDIREMNSISSEARNLAAAKDLEYMHKAMAIVVTSPAMKLVANFFIHFHKPPRPTQLFSSPEEAKIWLLTFA